MIMEKKVYITPVVVTVLMNATDGILLTASQEGGGKHLLGNGGETEGTVYEAGTKDEGDFNLWDE